MRLETLGPFRAGVLAAQIALASGHPASIQGGLLKALIRASEYYMHVMGF